MAEKPSVVYDDMHEFFCYMDDSLIPTVIKEKELLSKYDPEKARGFKAGFEKEDV